MIKIFIFLNKLIYNKYFDISYLSNVWRMLGSKMEQLEYRLIYDSIHNAAMLGSKRSELISRIWKFVGRSVRHFNYSNLNSIILVFCSGGAAQLFYELAY